MKEIIPYANDPLITDGMHKDVNEYTSSVDSSHEEETDVNMDRIGNTD